VYNANLCPRNIEIKINVGGLHGNWFNKPGIECASLPAAILDSFSSIHRNCTACGNKSPTQLSLARLINLWRPITDELREKSDMDIADFKDMMNTTLLRLFRAMDLSERMAGIPQL
jgi:hypothetical protein